MADYKLKPNVNGLISVIVPVYNTDKYLHNCIESLRNQTYPNLEIILVNDGSTDNSKSICLEYARIDKRIKLINQENSGQGKARNTGLQNSSGEYFAFIDSDDRICPDMFRKMLNFAKENSLEIVECDIQRVYNSNDNCLPKSHESIIEKKEIFLQRVLRNQFFSVCRRIYSANILNNLQFKEGRAAEDVYFTIDILSKVNRLGYIKFPFYCYFVGNSNSTTRRNYNTVLLETTIDSIIYVKKKVLLYSDPKLDFIVKKIVCDVILFNYKSLFINPELDPSKKYRSWLKGLLDENFTFKGKTDIVQTTAFILPISIFGFLWSLYEKFKGILKILKRE